MGTHCLALAVNVDNPESRQEVSFAVVVVQLIKSKRLPVVLYGLEACH